jgi:hypothetical protein
LFRLSPNEMNFFWYATSSEEAKRIFIEKRKAEIQNLERLISLAK